MARTGAWLEADEARIVRGDGPRARVVPVDVDAIVAEIAREEMPVVGGEIDRVGVRALLALRIRSLAGVLIDRRGAEASVRSDAEPHHAAAGVVRDRDGVPRSRDGEMAGISAARRDAIELGELARAVDPVRDDEARGNAAGVGRADFRDRVEEAAVAAEGDP